MPEESSRYVVHQLRWTPEGRRLPGSFPVASFADGAEAKACQRERERAARRGVNPFSFGGPALFHKASLDAGRLHDWLLDQGIQHPPGEEDWRLWCYNKFPNLDAAQQEAMWGALDKVRFFEVREVPARSAFLVMEFCWKVGVQTGDGMPCDPEGGLVREIHRTAEAARAALARLEVVLREGELSGIADGAAHGHYVVERLTGSWPTGALSVEQVPLGEMIEVPMMDEVDGRTAYLLQRRALEPGGFCTNYNGDPTEGVVPLALYATRGAAEADAGWREAEARRVASPFDFPGYHHNIWYVTSREFPAFREGAERLGLYPRGKKRGRWGGGEWDRYMPHCWADLWDECVDELTDEQRDGVWGLLDRLHFYEVVEVTLDG